MPTRGSVAFKKVLKMLKKCAPGHTIEDKTHLRWIRHKEKCVRVSQGPHGAGNDYELKIGQARGIVTHLAIDPDCARKYLPQLRL